MFPDGKSCVGGQPFQQTEEGKKKEEARNGGMRKHSLFFYYTIWMLYPGEHRMLFTGVNEEPGWLPRLPMFPTYTSLLITQLHFL